MFLIDVPNFVEDVPGVLPVINQDLVGALFRYACEIFGDRQHAHSWLHACSEGDLVVLHDCVRAAVF